MDYVECSCGVPAPVPYANLTNPQTLNLYAMVSDNPETFADLDGHACDDSDNSCKSDTPSNTPPPPGESRNAGTGDGTQKSTTQQLQQALLAITDFAKAHPMDVALTAIAIVATPETGGGSDVADAVAVGRDLGPVEKEAIKTVDNIVSKELDTKTLQAAAREAKGEVVAIKRATGDAFEHIPKVQNGLRGLKNSAMQLVRSLRQGGLNPEARAVVSRAQRAADRAMSLTKQFMEKHNIPF